MSYKKTAIFLMLCISVVITSCAAHTPSEPLSSTVSSEELLDNSFPNLVSVTDANLKTIVGSGSEDGFYEVKSAQNGHYIYFTDYVSQQQIILCPIPNCQHNDSSCPGFLSSEFTDYAGVFICGDKLILSCSAPSHQIPVALYIMGLDGTEKKLLHQFSANETPHDPVLFDGQAIYYVLSKVSYSSDEKKPIYSASLYRLDFASGENTEISTLGSQDSIAGIVSGNIIIKSVSSDKCNLSVVSTNGEKTSLDFTWPIKYPTYMTSNSIFFLSDDLAIQRYNYSNKEVTSFVLPDELHSATGITFDGFWDDKLFLIIFTSDNSIKEVAVNMESGEIKDVLLCGLDSSGQRKRPLCIATEFNDYFLVETGTIDDSQSQRALILKDDYWAGNPNYMYIKKQ